MEICQVLCVSTNQSSHTWSFDDISMIFQTVSRHKTTSHILQYPCSYVIDHAMSCAVRQNNARKQQEINRWTIICWNSIFCPTQALNKRHYRSRNHLFFFFFFNLPPYREFSTPWEARQCHFLLALYHT